MPVSWAKVVTMALALPGVALSTSYGTPALKVGKKTFLRLKEDGETFVLWLASLDEQEAAIEARPDVYFITDHYRGYPLVLVRLAKLTVAEAREHVEAAWRLRAPPKIKKLPSPRAAD